MVVSLSTCYRGVAANAEGGGPVVELHPRVILLAAPARLCGAAGPVPGASAPCGAFYALREADEKWPQHGNGPKDDDEPHLGQDPGVEFGDGVGDVLGLRDGSDGDGFVDACNSRSAAKSQLAQREVGIVDAYITPPPMMRQRPIFKLSFMCWSDPIMYMG